MTIQEINDLNIEIGDEIVNRHGTKGRVLKITGNDVYVMWCNMGQDVPVLDKWSINSICRKTGERSGTLTIKNAIEMCGGVYEG